MLLKLMVYGDFLQASRGQKPALPLPCLPQPSTVRLPLLSLWRLLTLNTWLPPRRMHSSLVRQGQRWGRLGCPEQQCLSPACCSHRPFCTVLVTTASSAALSIEGGCCRGQLQAGRRKCANTWLTPTVHHWVALCF